MNEFITVKLKDIGRIVTGKTPSSKEPESYGESYLLLHLIILKTNTLIKLYVLYQNMERMC